MHRIRRTNARGFTLIEMLMVIAIIAILVALLVPAMGRARNATKRIRALNDVQQIATAFQSYYNEYHAYPKNLVGYDNLPDDQMERQITGIQVKKSVLDMLSGASTNANPRRIPFLEIPKGSLNAAGDFVDPWDDGDATDPNIYKYMCDYNQDGKVSVLFTDQSVGEESSNAVGVAVWSRGRDQSDRAGDQNNDGKSDQDDDIRSWAR